MQLKAGPWLAQILLLLWGGLSFEYGVPVRIPPEFVYHYFVPRCEIEAALESLAHFSVWGRPRESLKILNAEFLVILVCYGDSKEMANEITHMHHVDENDAIP